MLELFIIVSVLALGLIFKAEIKDGFEKIKDKFK
jgi:hypothetical protein